MSIGFEKEKNANRGVRFTFLLARQEKPQFNFQLRFFSSICYASSIASRVTSKAKNGSIVLFHNNSDNILASLKMVLEYFKTRKTQVVPIGELIYYDNFTINNQGVQIKTK